MFISLKLKHLMKNPFSIVNSIITQTFMFHCTGLPYVRVLAHYMGNMDGYGNRTLQCHVAILAWAILGC